MDARPAGQRNRAQPFWRKEFGSERGQLAGSSTSRRRGTFRTVIERRAQSRQVGSVGYRLPFPPFAFNQPRRPRARLAQIQRPQSGSKRIARGQLEPPGGAGKSMPVLNSRTFQG